MNTKTTFIVIAAVALTALLALGGGVAFAQTQQPDWGSGFGPGWMMGGNAGATWGMAGARGMLGGHMGNGAGMAGMQPWMSADNGMHTLIWNALAEKLGLTTDELAAQLAQGQTLAQLAEMQGVSQAALSQALQTAGQAGLTQAVAEGVLTQAQADQMLTHLAGRYEQMLLNMGTGGCHGAPTTQPNS